MDGKKLFRNIVVNGCLLGCSLSVKAFPVSIEEMHDFCLKDINEKSLEVYLDEGGDANADFLYGTLLSCFASCGHYKLVQLLLKRGADPDLVNSDHHGTPLVAAVDGGHREVVELLLKYGADPSKRSEFYVPLTAAVRFCCFKNLEIGLKIMALLLEKGAEPNPDFDEVLLLPLHAAVYHGADLQVINGLIDGGTNVDEKDREGNTPLHVAAENGSFLQAQALIDKGASINELNTFNSTPLDRAFVGRSRIRREMNEQRIRNPLLKNQIDQRYAITIGLLRSHGAVVGDDTETDSEA